MCLDAWSRPSLFVLPLNPSDIFNLCEAIAADAKRVMTRAPAPATARRVYISMYSLGA